MRLARTFWVPMVAVFLFGQSAVGTSCCHAGGGPENVFLIVNSTSRDSLTVANHYVALRGIPQSHVFYLAYQGKKSAIKVASFREQILLPVLAEVEKRRLVGQIDYLVYSCDFPWRVDLKGDFPKEKSLLSNAPYASLTGATYLWGFVKEKRKEIVGFNTNWYFTEQLNALAVSRAFRSQYRWAAGGRRTREGLSYMISSMLGVTGARGNSVDEIIHSLQRAKQADGTKPSGTVYFMQHKGPRSTPRHDFFKDTATGLRRLGVEAKVLEGKFPTGKKNIAGLTCGVARVNVKASGCKFLPGAFCDNLTSYGAMLLVPKNPIDTKTGKRKVPQVSVCDFIRAGATGACGTVFEPTSAWPKFPQPSLQLHYVRGCSLGEAFYQSVAGPYQQLLVGDPLCQPWAERMSVDVAGFTPKGVLRGAIEIAPSATTSVGRKVAFFELYVDGRRVQRNRVGTKFTLDTTTLEDGYHDLRVVAVDDTPLETQSRWVGNVLVKNGRDAVQLSVDKSSVKKGMKYLAVKAVSTNGKPVVVLHNGRELGRVAERSGTVQIAVDQLGSGPVVLFGRTEGESGIRSQGLEIDLP